MEKLLCFLIFSCNHLFGVLVAQFFTPPCFPDHCSPQFGHCVVVNHQGSLSGTCHALTWPYYPDCTSPEVNYKLDNGEYCQCPDNKCVDRMEQANAHLDTHYECLSHKCYGNAWCHLYEVEADKGIRSECISKKPDNGITCIDQATVKTSDGCYCNTRECVHNTALHALGTSCHADREIEFYKDSGTYHARCQPLYHTRHDCEIFLVFLIDLIDNDKTFLPCACKTQSCAHTMVTKVHEAIMSKDGRTTTTLMSIAQVAPTVQLLMSTDVPTTTTLMSIVPVAPTVQRLTLYPFCVQRHCDASKPYCHLYIYNSKPDGSCTPFKVGPECIAGNDLSATGCHCETTKCMIDAIQAFNDLHITDVTTTEQTTTEIPTTKQTTTEIPTELTTRAPYAFCLHQQCDASKPYCHLYIYGSKPDGSCTPFKVGSECIVGGDLNATGCYCETTRCIVYAIQAFNDLHKTEVSTAKQTTTEIPTKLTTRVQTGMVCGDQTCDLNTNYCHLFHYKGVASGRCMPFNVWQPCKSYTGLYHQGCTCTTTACISNMLTDFAAAITTTSAFSPTNVPVTSAFTAIPSTTTVSNSSNTHIVTSTAVALESTTLWFTVPRERETSITLSTDPKVSTVAQTASPSFESSGVTSDAPLVPSTSLPVEQTTTWFYIPHVQETSTAVLTDLEVSTVETTVDTSDTPLVTSTALPVLPTIPTTAAPQWHCLNVVCQPNEACRLYFGHGGINALCEVGGTEITDCVDHQSIMKDGCLCRTLHCFGNNCPADKTCKITRGEDGSFTGNCSVLDFSHLSFCSNNPETQLVSCDCWTQSCIDPFQAFSTLAKQPTTVLASNPPAIEAPASDVKQLPQTVRYCNKCGDKDSSIPCTNREIIMDLQSTCSPGEDYCMTDIYHDSNGQIDVYKRCVNKATCELEWIGQSAELDYCKKYGVINNSSAFQCHFCCVSDGCNTNKMPNSTTLFTKVR